MRTMTVSLSVVCCGALAMTCLTGTCAWADVNQPPASSARLGLRGRETIRQRAALPADRVGDPERDCGSEKVRIKGLQSPSAK